MNAADVCDAEWSALAAAVEDRARWDRRIRRFTFGCYVVAWAASGLALLLAVQVIGALR